MQPKSGRTQKQNSRMQEVHDLVKNKMNDSGIPVQTECPEIALRYFMATLPVSVKNFASSYIKQGLHKDNKLSFSWGLSNYMAYKHMAPGLPDKVRCKAQSISFLNKAVKVPNKPSSKINAEDADLHAQELMAERLRYFLAWCYQHHRERWALYSSIQYLSVSPSTYVAILPWSQKDLLLLMSFKSTKTCLDKFTL